VGEQNLRTMASRIDELPLELAPVGVLGHVDHIWVGGSACIELESPQTCRGDAELCRLRRRLAAGCGTQRHRLVDQRGEGGGSNDFARH
jgi:hypothetical protein